MAKKRKRKVRFDRVLLLVLLFVFIVALLTFGIKALINKPDDNDSKDNNTQTNKETLTIELLDYEVYEDKDDKLGFNFIVATLEFKADKEIDYDLNNLITDEAIRLNNISDYQKKMNINSYNYEDLNTSVDVKSKEKSIQVKVFVPYINQRDLVIITDTVTGSSISINTNNNKKDLDDIKYVSTENEIKTSSYQFKISNNYISTMMKHNGEDYDCSMLSVYTFDLTVESIKEDTRIIGATFKQNATNESWEALDSSFSSYKIDNIINKELKVNDTYALFFEVYSNINDKPSYEGKININFNDGSTVTIDTTLN